MAPRSARSRRPSSSACAPGTTRAGKIRATHRRRPASGQLTFRQGWGQPARFRPAGDRVRHAGAERAQRREHLPVASFPRLGPRRTRSPAGSRAAASRVVTSSPAARSGHTSQPKDGRRIAGARARGVGANRDLPAVDVRRDEVLQLLPREPGRPLAWRRASRRTAPPRGSRRRAPWRENGRRTCSRSARASRAASRAPTAAARDRAPSSATRRRAPRLPRATSR